jgi:RimJ/RimL family protein N-acetyltransferase
MMSESQTPLPTLRTERLTLVALTPAAYTAWAAGDAAALSDATGIAFPDAAAPPLLSEDLPKIRDLALARWDPKAMGWWGWLATLTATGEPVGSVGFAGHPDDGVATIGYSIYERHQGLGYGTEATAAAVSWALSHEDVDGVRATIPDWNAPSLRLAEKIGFVMTGTAEDPEVGEVLVYEIGRP